MVGADEVEERGECVGGGDVFADELFASVETHSSGSPPTSLPSAIRAYHYRGAFETYTR